MPKKSEYHANEVKLEEIQLRASLVLFGDQANFIHRPIQDYLPVGVLGELSSGMTRVVKENIEEEKK